MLPRFPEKFLRIWFAVKIIVAASFAASELPQVDGTTGTPLGGFGTGAIKFCGNNGKFYFADQAPAKCANNQTSYVVLNAKFAFFSSRGGAVVKKDSLIAVSSGGRVDDDAIYPVQKANFGVINGVNVRLTGTCPWLPQDSNKMAWPCALFEFAVTNNQSTSVEVAIGFKLGTGSAPVLVANKGFKDEITASQKAIYAKSSDAAAVITIGGDANFAATGLCGNAISGTANMVAVKLSLAPNETKQVKFVFAWYYTANTALHYYTNLFSGAGAVADSGLANFDSFKSNAETLVSRMRSSNVPDWIVNTTLNSLCGFTNNSRYMKDKRTFFAEGQWGAHGTMDQIWYARQINSQLCPYYAWKELEFWARTQKTDAANLGQIHHDLGDCSSAATWDQTTWADISTGVNNWPDLNCGFIIGVYETFIATGDRAKLDYFWPYVLKAGQRILTQLALYGNTAYPYTFEDAINTTYDWNSVGANQLYASSLSLTTFAIMSKLASIKSDAATKAKYDAAHDTAVVSFKKRFIDSIFTTGHYCEAIGTGPWLSDFLKLGQDFSSGDIDKLLARLNTFYNPLTDGCGKLEGPDFGGNYYIWQMHLILHYADLSLIAGKKDIWYAIRHDNFQRNYQNRNRVFNTQLGTYNPPTSQIFVATDPSGIQTYMTNPALFRDYYTIIGYQRNKNSGELWLEPNLPASMNDTLKNAFYIAPEGNGTIAFIQNPTSFEQWITFTPDTTIRVDQIYVKDKYGATHPPVYVNKIRIPEADIARIGMGYGKELKINWTGAVTPSGLTVEITSSVPVLTKKRLQAALSTVSRVTVSGKQVHVRTTLDKQERVAFTLFRVDGKKTVGITLHQEAGTHEIVLNRLLAGFNNLSGATYLLQVSIGKGKWMYKILLP